MLHTSIGIGIGYSYH